MDWVRTASTFQRYSERAMTRQEVLVLFFLVGLGNAWGWQELWQSRWRKCQKAIGLGALALMPFTDVNALLSSSSNISPCHMHSLVASVHAAEVAAQPNSLQAQLLVIRTNMIEAQKNMMEVCMRISALLLLFYLTTLFYVYIRRILGK